MERFPAWRHVWVVKLQTALAAALCCSKPSRRRPAERSASMSGASPPVADALLPHRHLDRVEAFWVLDSTAEFDLTAPPAQPAPGPSSSSPAASPTPFGAAADDDPHLLVLHA